MDIPRAEKPILMANNSNAIGWSKSIETNQPVGLSRRMSRPNGDRHDIGIEVTVPVT